MKKLALLLTLALACTLSAASALAAPVVYTIDPNHSQIGFSIRHVVSRVSGRFNTYSGEITVDKDNPAASKVSAEIEAKSIDTANTNRDNHLRSGDFFDVEKFPKITFVSKSLDMAGKDKGKLTGDLTMHGVTKPVTLDVTWGGFSGPKAGFEAKTTVNRKDFGITWNTMLDSGGVMLGDDVDITINIEANDMVMAKALKEKKEAEAKEKQKQAAPPAPEKK